jgi:hypothetical protein
MNIPNILNNCHGTFLQADPKLAAGFFEKKKIEKKIEIIFEIIF